jgi:hypothetical protein
MSQTLAGLRSLVPLARMSVEVFEAQVGPELEQLV